MKILERAMPAQPFWHADGAVDPAGPNSNWLLCGCSSGIHQDGSKTCLLAFFAAQAFALSKPDRPDLVELLRAQPAVPTPGHRIVVDPPSTLEPLPLPPGSNLSAGGAAAADGQAGSLGLGGLGYAGSIGAALDDAAAANEEPLPDDVPLTRAQLQAKVGCELLAYAKNAGTPAASCLAIWMQALTRPCHLSQHPSVGCHIGLRGLRSFEACNGHTQDVGMSHRPAVPCSWHSWLLMGVVWPLCACCRW